MNRSKNAVRNVFWGIVNKSVTILLPFISRTVLLYKLGAEYIGLNSLFVSFLGLLSLSELGIGSALIFSMYEPIAKKDTDRICKLLNLYRKCYAIIGFVVLVIGLVLLPFLELFIAGGCPEELNIYLLYSIYLVNTVLSYWLFSYKKSLLIATQRIDIQSNINTIVIFVQNIVQIIILFLFSNYYFYLLVLPFITLIENIIISCIVDAKYPTYKPKGKLSIKELKGLNKKILGLLFQRIGNVVLSAVDSLVISTFLGLTVLGIYNNYYYVITALMGIVSIFQSSLIPIVGNKIVLDSKDKNYETFRMLNFMYIWIIIWCSSTLLCLFQPFMNIWAGDNAIYSFPMIVTLTIYFFTYKWGDMLFVYQEASGIWWETRFVPLIASLVNLSINIFLVNTIGIIGIPISTIISVVFVYDFGYAKLLFKHYFGLDKLRRFILKEFLYVAVAIIISAATYYLCSLLVLNDLFSIIVNFIICIIISNLLLILLLHKTKEFKLVKKFVLDKIVREKNNV